MSCYGVNPHRYKALTKSTSRQASSANQPQHDYVSYSVIPSSYHVRHMNDGGPSRGGYWSWYGEETKFKRRRSFVDETNHQVSCLTFENTSMSYFECLPLDYVYDHYDMDDDDCRKMKTVSKEDYLDEATLRWLYGDEQVRDRDLKLESLEEWPSLPRRPSLTRASISILALRRHALRVGRGSAISSSSPRSLVSSSKESDDGMSQNSSSYCDVCSVESSDWEIV